MSLGRVHLWQPDVSSPLGGRILLERVPLPNLDAIEPVRLSGHYVRVRNASVLDGLPLGDARPDPDGDFLFDPARGGRRVDRTPSPDPRARESYTQASRFGEVNAYFHLDRIASYVDGLLRALGAASLPRVTAVVSAHSATAVRNGTADGVRHRGRWRPFQGGHYRLPGPRLNIREPEPVSPEGEIHLGPGWELLEHGAFVEAAGAAYRHNASHNAGILCHEYGHHVTRHLADFQGNARRPPELQENRKTSLDEGISDYWAATMLGSPHIWAWHRRHDDRVRHRRSLLSPRTMADFIPGPDVDLHANGTIWAAALWDLRTRMARPGETDLLLAKSLLLSGEVYRGAAEADIDRLRYGEESYFTGLDVLLRADAELNGSAHRALILEVFGARGIRPVSPPFRQAVLTRARASDADLSR